MTSKTWYPNKCNHDYRVKMNVVAYIAITCNLKNVRLQITFDYMKNVIQNGLNVLSKLCSSWKLEVNTKKSKIMIFNSNGKSFLNHFKLDNEYLESWCESMTNAILEFNSTFSLMIHRINNIK
jgi:hypothetical protein